MAGAPEGGAGCAQMQAQQPCRRLRPGPSRHCSTASPPKVPPTAPAPAPPSSGAAPKIPTSPDCQRPAAVSPARHLPTLTLRRNDAVLCVISHYAEWQGYRTLRTCAERAGWIVEPTRPLAPSDALCCVCLYGKALTIDGLRMLKGRSRRVSHFPLMFLVTDKVFLELTYRRMEALRPALYRHVRPRTYLTLSEIPVNAATLVLKGCRGAQGKAVEVVHGRPQPGRMLGAVAQEYVEPFLVDGRKIDLRVYCLVLSADPLVVYVHREGLMHLCAEPYREPQPGGRPTQHIGNYVVNCRHADFVRPSANGDSGCLRSFASLSKLLRNPSVFWRRVDECIIRTLAPVAPYLARGMRAAGQSGSPPLTCFELLGVDFAVARDESPLLLEINHLPGLMPFSEFDGGVKEAVVSDTFRLLGISPDCQLLADEVELLAGKARRRPRQETLARILERDSRLLPETGYRRIYPLPARDRGSRRPVAAVQSRRDEEVSSLLEAAWASFEDDAVAAANGALCPYDARSRLLPPATSPSAAAPPPGYTRWLDQCSRELHCARTYFLQAQRPIIHSPRARAAK
eukprot:TRINITY_DN30878_c0_g1_i1.p1 TRINITY_DN30878_c0_g1~~TRINITY_DN30878_c0_g1_i1.p1  ORF type:complete len:586 (+),score=123.12 TRINITY_DN30878_c0_g1_i1:46-1758(+)